MLNTFYKLEELRGALVVDSEGLVHGVFEELRFRPKPLLVVTHEFKANTLVPDEKRLRKLLEEAGVDLSSVEGLAELVALARRAGVEIPHTIVEKNYRVVKSLVPLEEVMLVDIATLEYEGSRETVKLILLSTPREARFRGVQSTPSKPVNPGELLGKLFVSLSRGVLGKALDIVLGAGGLGYRVYRRRGAVGYINWVAFIAEARRVAPRDVVDRLIDIADPLLKPRLPLAMLERIRSVLAGSHLEELLERFVVREVASEDYIDIPLDYVVKVGDVVLTW